jgi:hypothetical protein
MQYSHTKKIKRDDKHPFLNKNYSTLANYARMDKNPVIAIE